MKKYISFLLIFISASTFAQSEQSIEQTIADQAGQDTINQAHQDANDNGCDSSKKENIVCANIMCDFGLIMGEWPSECTDYKLKLAIEKAKLPPWKKLPKCFMKDTSCKKSGRARKSEVTRENCDDLPTASERHGCRLSLELDEQEGAEEYLTDNGADADVLDDVEFREVEEQEETFGDFTYLITNVDERFEEEVDLDTNIIVSNGYFIGRGNYFRNNSGINGIDHLTFYLENRDDPTMTEEVEDARRLLVEGEVMRDECANIAFNEFYNCNFYPDLPQECWGETAEDQIAICARQNEIASN